jgi:hypothetical protein
MIFIELYPRRLNSSLHHHCKNLRSYKMNNVFGRMWEEAVRASYEVESWHFLEVNEERKP